MIIVLRSTEWPSSLDFPTPPDASETINIHTVSPIPTRSELKVLNPLPDLVTEPTPTLDEIAAQPDVPHLGAPGPAPHVTAERVRIVVLGSDATLQAVVTKLLRIDALWAEVAYVPLLASDSSAAGNAAAPSSATGIAHNWALDQGGIDVAAAFEFALTAPARPTPVIRDDHAQVVLGSAEITGQPEASEGRAAGELFGEVIVDSDTLYNHDLGMKSPFTHGVRLVPTMDAPGIAAVQLPSPEQSGKQSWWAIFRTRFQQPVEPTVLQGRALQAGGRDMLVTRDGVPHPRPLKTVTFYRHLRDGQFVRR